MEKVLSKRNINALLKKVPDWTCNAKHTQIQRVLKTTTYIDGLVLIARIAVHAEILHHHPVIEYSHKSLKIKLQTHDGKRLSALDFKLAGRIDILVKST